jgi:hypothetical protein
LVIQQRLPFDDNVAHVHTRSASHDSTVRPPSHDAWNLIGVAWRSMTDGQTAFWLLYPRGMERKLCFQPVPSCRDTTGPSLFFFFSLFLLLYVLHVHMCLYLPSAAEWKWRTGHSEGETDLPLLIVRRKRQRHRLHLADPNHVQPRLLLALESKGGDSTRRLAPMKPSSASLLRRPTTARYTVPPPPGPASWLHRRSVPGGKLQRVGVDHSSNSPMGGMAWTNFSSM